MRKSISFVSSVQLNKEVLSIEKRSMSLVIPQWLQIGLHLSVDDWPIRSQICPFEQRFNKGAQFVLRSIVYCYWNTSLLIIHLLGTFWSQWRSLNDLLNEFTVSCFTDQAHSRSYTTAYMTYVILYNLNYLTRISFCHISWIGTVICRLHVGVALEKGQTSKTSECTWRAR